MSYDTRYYRVVEAVVGPGVSRYPPRVQIVCRVVEDDWRSDRFLIMSRPGLTKRSAFIYLLTYYVPHVIGHPPHRFTMKFTGNDRTCLDVILMHHIHDMLRPSLREYMIRFHPSEVRQVSRMLPFALPPPEGFPSVLFAMSKEVLNTGLRPRMRTLRTGEKH